MCGLKAPKPSLSRVAILTRADTSRWERRTTRRVYHFFFSQPSKNTMPQNTCSSVITSVMKAGRQATVSAQSQVSRPQSPLNTSLDAGSWGALHYCEGSPTTDGGPWHNICLNSNSESSISEPGASSAGASHLECEPVKQKVNLDLAFKEFLLGTKQNYWYIISFSKLAFYTNQETVFFFFWPHTQQGVWDLSSLTRDWIHAPCIGSSGVFTIGQPVRSPRNFSKLKQVSLI